MGVGNGAQRRFFGTLLFLNFSCYFYFLFSISSVFILFYSFIL